MAHICIEEKCPIKHSCLRYLNRHNEGLNIYVPKLYGYKNGVWVCSYYSCGAEAKNDALKPPPIT